MKEVRVDKKEIINLMKELEEDKATGPDEVSGKILKECRNELINPVYDIIKCSVESGKVPVEWKRAEIAPI